MKIDLRHADNCSYRTLANPPAATCTVGGCAAPLMPAQSPVGGSIVLERAAHRTASGAVALGAAAALATPPAGPLHRFGRQRFSLATTRMVLGVEAVGVTTIVVYFACGLAALLCE